MGGVGPHERSKKAPSPQVRGANDQLLPSIHCIQALERWLQLYREYSSITGERYSWGERGDAASVGVRVFVSFALSLFSLFLSLHIYFYYTSASTIRIAREKDAERRSIYNDALLPPAAGTLRDQE